MFPVLTSDKLMRWVLLSLRAENMSVSGSQVGKFKPRGPAPEPRLLTTTFLSQLPSRSSQGSRKDRSEYHASGYIQARITSSQGLYDMNERQESLPGGPSALLGPGEAPCVPASPCPPAYSLSPGWTEVVASPKPNG